MKPTVYVPTAEFRRVLTEYANGSMKSVKDTINGRLLDILVKAYQRTKIATRAQLEKELGIVSKFRVSKKTGERKRAGFSLAEAKSSPGQSFASLIVNASRVARGEKALGGAELAAAARKMVGARIRSIGFIRSGWIPGLKVFNALRDAAKAGRVRGGRAWIAREQVGQPKGTGHPATSILKPEATASNTTKVASIIGQDALRSAFAESQANMLDILAGNLDKVRAKYANRVIK
jgi:hypothetical protein